MTILESVLWTLATLPIVIVALVVAGANYGAYSLRRSVRVAAKTRCPHCEAVLGREAVIRGEKEFVERIQKLRDENPGVKYRIVAEWQIECRSCGKTSFFSPDDNTIGTQTRFANKPAHHPLRSE